MTLKRKLLALALGCGLLLVADQVFLYAALADGSFLGRRIAPFSPPLFHAQQERSLERLRQICLAFPEVSEGQSFGAPTFKAGKKTFVEFNTYSGGPAALFRVGAERQVALTADPRFDLPPYMGPKGWIRLSLDERFDDAEIRALADESYRHFALKRMLKALDGQ